MSGHSKWANIRVRKGAQDAARGKIFTRHARLVEIAARAGGGDPSMNSALRTAIENAKADSVPNANIERAIKKGTGELKGEAMQEIVYEAYGPAGTAYIIECLSDNRNRTIANVKSIIGTHGGRLADQNAVSWMFARKGLVVGQKGSAAEGKNVEELELELIDVGAEDISLDAGTLRVVTGPGDWPKIRDFLKSNGWEVLSAGLSYIPTQKVPVTDLGTAKKVAGFIEALEEDDDVSDVHTNADISVEVAAQLA
jgi:YebC/PmpR family DNA-binding regulatory protein